MATWNSGLLGCFDDCSICCYGCCCTSCLYGENTEKIDGSSCIGSCFVWWLLSQCGLCCLVHKGKRRALRARYHLQENCDDCIATTCCSSCAMCQEARELKFRSASEEPIPVVVQPMVLHTYIPTGQPAIIT